MARVVIFGKSGSGKSWFTGQKLAEILEPEDEEDEFEYAVHLDLEDEEKGLSMTEDPLLYTFPVGKDRIDRQAVVNPDNPPDYIPESELKDGPLMFYPKLVFYKNKYVRVVPDGLSEGEVWALVEMMADAAMHTGDCHFSMDEAHRVASDGTMGPRLDDVITGGRKRGVEWAFITQRPQKISKTVIAQSDIGVFFKLTSERDVKKADKLAESFDAEDLLATLDERVAIIEDYSEGTAKKVDTNDLERAYPHVAGDDGKANDKWVGDGEEFEPPE